MLVAILAARGIFLSVAQLWLAPAQQEQPGSLWPGLLVVVAGLGLLLLFWSWWRTVAREDMRLDGRLTNQPVKPAAVEVAKRAPYELPAAARVLPAEAVAMPPPPPAAGADQAGGAVAASQPAAAAADAPAAADPASVDDLTRIEGVGPKIATLLQESGIHTYAALAQTEVTQLAALLQAAGPAYRLAAPATWPEQAALAAADRWDDLAALQGTLQGGQVPD